MTDPITATQGIYTGEDVRVALQSIPLGPTLTHTCDLCGSEYNSPSAALACEEADTDMRPRS